VRPPDKPYLIPNAAVRDVLPGVPDDEDDDPELIAGGVFMVEHDPPFHDRRAEAVGELNRCWDGAAVTNDRWHRYWRQVHDPSLNDGRSTGTDNDIDHWFEVGAWRVEDCALVIERADREGTMRFRRLRDRDEARRLAVAYVPEWGQIDGVPPRG
jgi:hypothetical protein